MAKGSLTTSIFTANHLSGAALVPSIAFCSSAGPVFLLKGELSFFIQKVFSPEILYQLPARVLQLGRCSGGGDDFDDHGVLKQGIGVIGVMMMVLIGMVLMVVLMTKTKT